MSSWYLTEQISFAMAKKYAYIIFVTTPGSSLWGKEWKDNWSELETM
jgi:hypothetical protein